MDRREHSVEIREFKEYGLDKTAIKFNSLKLLDDYLGWPHSYSGGIIRKSRHDLIRNKFILHDLSEPHKWYIVWKFEGKIVATDKDIENFYTGHRYNRKVPGIVAHAPKMSRKELNQALERKKRRSALLIAIAEKYGGVENAEGTWELKELRDMIGANEDGRKKHKK